MADEAADEYEYRDFERSTNPFTSLIDDPTAIEQLIDELKGVDGKTIEDTATKTPVAAIGDHFCFILAVKGVCGPLVTKVIKEGGTEELVDCAALWLLGRLVVMDENVAGFVFLHVYELSVFLSKKKDDEVIHSQCLESIVKILENTKVREIYEPESEGMTVLLAHATSLVDKCLASRMSDPCAIFYWVLRLLHALIVWDFVYLAGNVENLSQLKHQLFEILCRACMPCACCYESVRCLDALHSHYGSVELLFPDEKSPEEIRKRLIRAAKMVAHRRGCFIAMTGFVQRIITMIEPVSFTEVNIFLDWFIRANRVFTMPEYAPFLSLMSHLLRICEPTNGWIALNMCEYGMKVVGMAIRFIQATICDSNEDHNFNEKLGCVITFVNFVHEYLCFLVSHSIRYGQNIFNDMINSVNCFNALDLCGALIQEQLPESLDCEEKKDPTECLQTEAARKCQNDIDIIEAFLERFRNDYAEFLNKRETDPDPVNWTELRKLLEDHLDSGDELLCVNLVLHNAETD